jgi:5-methylcytosine-specific restriction endonuclease McrA
MTRKRPIDGLPRLELKRALRARDGAWCCFCKEYLELAEATLEHVIPFSHGGGNELDNLRLSCVDCNEARGVQEFWEFMATAARRGRTRKRGSWARSWRARPFSNPRARPQRLTLLGLALIAAGFIPVQQYGEVRRPASSLGRRS